MAAGAKRILLVGVVLEILLVLVEGQGEHAMCLRGEEREREKGGEEDRK